MRRRLTLAAALLPLLLAGCGLHHRHHPGPRGTPDPANPQVMVFNGRVQVDQEVLRFTKPRTETLITWRLPPGGPYRFAANGIQFDKRAEGEIVRCRIGERPTEFSCLNLNTRRDFYKYDVRVLDGDKPLEPLDPFVINDW